MGRRKIEMKMVKERSSRQVTFSKRRTGLYKKANELATLCATQIAIVVFSPGGKPFSFGNPYVDLVVNMFLNQRGRDIHHDADEERPEIYLRERLCNMHIDFETKKISREAIAKKLKEKSRLIKFKVGFNERGLKDLDDLKKSMKEIREKAKKMRDETVAWESLLLLAKDPFKISNLAITKK